jgi:GNAT acetyltransferase-like protein
MGDLVTLRPVAEDDLAWLASLRDGPAATGVHEWFGWRDPQRRRKQWAETGLLGENAGTLVVQHGTEAQRLAARYLFAHTQVNRIEATTEITNVAEQRALEKAGFTREGVLRGTTFRQGRWHDQVIYSVLRDEADLDEIIHPET